MSLPLPGRTALSWTCGDTDVTLWHAQGCLRVNDAMWSHIYPVLGLLARSLHAGWVTWEIPASDPALHRRWGRRPALWLRWEIRERSADREQDKERRCHWQAHEIKKETRDCSQKRVA